MEIAIFWQKAVSWRKIKEKRPHQKFNFTTRTSSIYLSRPFLKLGNGIGLIFTQPVDENIKLLITWYPSMFVWVVPPSLRDMTGMLG